MATPQPVDARTQPWRETPGGDLVALGGRFARRCTWFATTRHRVACSAGARPSCWSYSP